mmetsp:Transcript_10862/g.33986  ORF Transcript_10862/g.33986 Transcript_10862/m.33986 type:complete len:296 (-) Transcript_10862:880-1767(-)
MCSTPPHPSALPDRSTRRRCSSHRQASARTRAPWGPTSFPESRSSRRDAAPSSPRASSRAPASPKWPCLRSRTSRRSPRPGTRRRRPSSPSALQPRRAATARSSAGARHPAPWGVRPLVRRSQDAGVGRPASAMARQPASASRLWRKPQARTRPAAPSSGRRARRPTSVMQLRSRMTDSRRQPGPPASRACARRTAEASARPAWESSMERRRLFAMQLPSRRPPGSTLSHCTPCMTTSTRPVLACSHLEKAMASAAVTPPLREGLAPFPARASSDTSPGAQTWSAATRSRPASRT